MASSADDPVYAMNPGAPIPNGDSGVDVHDAPPPEENAEQAQAAEDASLVRQLEQLGLLSEHIDTAATMRRSLAHGRRRRPCAKVGRVGVDFAFDLNRSSLMTVVHLSVLIYVFFGLIITGANPWVQQTASCTGLPPTVVLYAVGLVFVPLFGQTSALNNPGAGRPQAVGAVANLVLLLVVVVLMLIALANDVTTCRDSVRPLATVREMCPWEYSPASLNHERGREACAAAGGTFEAHPNTRYLGLVSISLPVATCLIMCLYLVLAFLRLMCTDQNAHVKRRIATYRHTIQVLTYVLMCFLRSSPYS